MAKMTKMQRKKAAMKAWRTRKKKYGKDGLTKKGLMKVKAAGRKRRKRRR